VQLVSTNMSDLTDQWDDPDPQALQRLLRAEMRLAGAVLRALANIFAPEDNGGYRAVDAA
jgi:hypothetical protein